jgi:hypothetical protein
MNSKLTRSRWAAIGAAVAVTLGAGGIGLVNATSPAGASTLVSITPCRLVDTRPAPENVGPKISPLGPTEILTVAAHGDNGNCTGIPSSATGLSLNVTAVGATAPTFLTIWATGDPQPEASSLNPVPGAPPTPNAVVAGLSAGGQFDIYNLQGSVNVIVDVNGYYTDHDHDDRYYTEAEIDARVGALEAAVAPLQNSAASYVGGDHSITLTNADDLQTIRSLSMTAPGDGKVIVSSSSWILNASAVAQTVNCEITTGTTISGDASQRADELPVSQTESIAGTRGFDVTSGQVFNVNLVCQKYDTGNVQIRDSWMTAIFAPD